MEGNKRIRMPCLRPLPLRPSKRQVFVMPRELDFEYPLGRSSRLLRCLKEKKKKSPTSIRGWEARCSEFFLLLIFKEN